MIGSPGLLTASLTNGKAATSGNVMIYAGAPGFVLPDKQARGLFGPFALQSDPVNSLTGALVAVETDAAVSGLGVPLAVARTYNSNNQSPGPLGPGVLVVGAGRHPQCVDDDGSHRRSVDQSVRAELVGSADRSHRRLGDVPLRR
ncbi:DUF6531 domain-containing protein [Kribbella sp. NPDC020789]